MLFNQHMNEFLAESIVQQRHDARHFGGVGLQAIKDSALGLSERLMAWNTELEHSQSATPGS